jgi:uncharacterized phage-associated protein
MVAQEDEIMGAPYSPKAVANAILQRAFNQKKSVTHLKLQKLVFISHGYFLADSDGVPLIDEPFEAWDFGPVCRSLYSEFRDCGAAPIAQLATEMDWDEGQLGPVAAPEDDVRANKIFDFVVKTYGGRSPHALSDLSHRPGWAWDRTRKADKYHLKNKDIDNEMIREDFVPYIKSKNANSTNRE